MRILVFLIPLLCLSFLGNATKKKKKYVTDTYPTSIPKYRVRRDVTTGKPVHSGLVHTLQNRSTLAEFKRHLQCAVNDPNLNYNNGMITMLRLAPPTVDSYLAFCSLVESKKYGNWSLVNENIQKYRQGGYLKKNNFNKLHGHCRAELLRVIKGELYIDWPWGMERFSPECNDNMMTLLIKIVLDRISDMRDSAFFTGGADPALPQDTAVPFLAFCTAETYADLIFPWSDMWKIVHREYMTFRREGLPFTEEGYRRLSTGHRPWAQRRPQAALYGTMMRHRQVMFDVARLHPSHLSAVALNRVRCIAPWHPASTEHHCTDFNEPMKRRPNASEVAASLHLPAGYVLPLFSIISQNFSSYQPATFKYVIVPLGEQRKISTSARIAHLLTYSGAVILMQRSMWRYHFSAQFLPWVHYVPFSFTGADLVEKIQWLRDHDDLARQIAENGRNFGRSYLRLEDFYCSVASTLDTLSEVTRAVAEAPPFSPMKVPIQCNPTQHVLYEVPK